MCGVLLSQLLYILFQFPRCKHGICAEKMFRHSAGSVLYEEMQRILHTNVNISFWQFLHLCSSSGSSFRRLQHMVFRYYYYYLWNSFFPTPFLRIFISLYFLFCWAFCLLNRLLGYMFPYTRTHIHIWSWQLPSQPIAVVATTKTTYNLLHFKYFCSKN